MMMTMEYNLFDAVKYVVDDNLRAEKMIDDRGRVIQSTRFPWRRVSH